MHIAGVTCAHVQLCSVIMINLCDMAPLHNRLDDRVSKEIHSLQKSFVTRQSRDKMTSASNVKDQ